MPARVGVATVARQKCSTIVGLKADTSLTAVAISLHALGAENYAVVSFPSTTTTGESALEWLATALPAARNEGGANGGVAAFSSGTAAGQTAVIVPETAVRAVPPPKGSTVEAPWVALKAAAPSSLGEGAVTASSLSAVGAVLTVASVRWRALPAAEACAILIVREEDLPVATVALTRAGHAVSPPGRVCLPVPEEDKAAPQKNVQYVGAWSLLKREDPVGATPEQHPAGDGPIRIQAPSGVYAEVRIPVATDNFYAQASNAGYHSIVDTSDGGRLSVRHRVVDFRPPTGCVLGTQVKFDREVMGELSHPKGRCRNEYIEAWTRLANGPVSALELVSETPAPGGGGRSRAGYWLFCGDRFVRVVGPRRGEGLVAGTCCASLQQLEALVGPSGVQTELRSVYEACCGRIEAPGRMRVSREAWVPNSDEGRLLFEDSRAVSFTQNEVIHRLANGIEQRWRVRDWSMDPFTPNSPGVSLTAKMPEQCAENMLESSHSSSSSSSSDESEPAAVAPSPPAVSVPAQMVAAKAAPMLPVAASRSNSRKRRKKAPSPSGSSSKSSSVSKASKPSASRGASKKKDRRKPSAKSASPTKHSSSRSKSRKNKKQRKSKKDTREKNKDRKNCPSRDRSRHRRRRHRRRHQSSSRDTNRRGPPATAAIPMPVRPASHSYPAGFGTYPAQVCGTRPPMGGFLYAGAGPDGIPRRPADGQMPPQAFRPAMPPATFGPPPGFQHRGPPGFGPMAHTAFGPPPGFATPPPGIWTQAGSGPGPGMPLGPIAPQGGPMPMGMPARPPNMVPPGGPLALPPMTGMPPSAVASGQVNLFLRDNLVDDKAAEHFRNLHPELQNQVMGEGVVCGKNPSAVLMTRIRSAEQRNPHDAGNTAKPQKSPSRSPSKSPVRSQNSSNANVADGELAAGAKLLVKAAGAPGACSEPAVSKAATAAAAAAKSSGAVPKSASAVALVAVAATVASQSHPDQVDAISPSIEPASPQVANASSEGASPAPAPAQETAETKSPVGETVGESVPTVSPSDGAGSNAETNHDNVPVTAADVPTSSAACKETADTGVSDKVEVSGSPDGVGSGWSDPVPQQKTS